MTLPSAPLLNPPLAVRGAFFFASAELERRTLGLEGALGVAVGGLGGGLGRRKTEGEGMLMASAIWLPALPLRGVENRRLKGNGHSALMHNTL